MSRGRRLVALAIATAFLLLPDAADAQLSLRSCGKIQCGRLTVPLDRSGVRPGSVSLYVKRQRALRRPVRGATLLLAGGPGQSATIAYDSGDPLPYDEFASLTPFNDMVVFDGRGTGHSGLLRCPELERANLVDAGREAALCARRLGDVRGFYRTSDSVEDIEAVRAALGVDKLTLIGVSYGTFLAQAYAARYPAHVERVLLDSVLDVSGWDPYYLDTFAAVPRVIRAVCRGSCSQWTNDPVNDLGVLVTRLQRHELRGKVTLPNGHRKRYGLTRQELLFTLVSGDLDELSRAQFSGAVLSANNGDTAPLLRLERHAVYTEGAGSAREFSSAEYAANTCEEIPFPWTRFSPPASRYGQIAAAVAQFPADDFYPFDAATTEGNDFMRMCRRWPEASPGPYTAPPPGSLPDVPVLMLSGEDDLRTPNETARSAAADWPNAQVVVVPNTGHSTLTADLSNCVSRAVRNFFRGTAVPARCRRNAALLPALPPAPLSLRQLRSVPGVPGVRGAAINAAELTLFDVTLEFLSTLISADQDTVRGGGLRGGHWALKLGKKAGRLTLDDVEYMPGIRVSGKITELGTRKERAVLHLSGPSTPDGELRFGRRFIEGRLDGKHVRSKLPGSSIATAARYGPVADRGRLVTTVLKRLRDLRRPLG
jgi:pimeloyl-ACP methyl ester carboxylesterase